MFFFYDCGRGSNDEKLGEAIRYHSFSCYFEFVGEGKSGMGWAKRRRLVLSREARQIFGYVKR